MSTENVSRLAPEKQFFGHPRSLATLFGMEVWERFSFYGMQGILLIYLYHAVSQGGLGINQPIAYGIVGAYSGGVYLASILGGWFADRVFGAERTLFYSGIVVMLGHIALAVLPGVHGVTAGLICVALGSGGVKATCSSLVGALYEPGSERRDAGFSIFYLGINIGGFVGPLLTGVLHEEFGFHYGFSIAAIGMAIGLIQYALGRRHLPESQKRAPNPLEPGRLKYYGLVVAALIGVLLLAISLGGVRADNISDVMLGVIAVAALAYFTAILRSPRINAEERRRVLAFIPLFLASGAYWALYSQSYTVIVAFFDQRVDRSVFGWQVPVGWLTSAQALTVVALSGIFAWLWTSLGKRQPSSASKFVIAMLIIGVTFLCYLPWLGAEAAAMPMFMLVLLLLGFTASELCLSPIGLSVTTRLAPAAFQTQMMALFFLSLALGFAAGGSLGHYYTQDNEVPYFIALAGLGIVTAVLLMLCLPFIKRASPGTE